MKLPILFVIFNRQEVAMQSFQSIKQYAPTRLYIAADGARDNRQSEKELCKKTRSSILSSIDWDCEVKTLFQDSNLGCGISVYTAINWFFENEEQGVILEDDCIAQPSFFPFAEEMLDRYKSDSRIGMVAGFNGTKYHCPDSYCFSKYAGCWGWATWRRAWQNMDITMEWRKTKFDDVLNNRGNCKEYNHWLFQLRYIDKKYVSAWDWQWYFSLASQNQLTIFPQVNLISNIGFGENATHTSGMNAKLTDKNLEFPLRHPKYVMPDMLFDKAFYEHGNTLYSVIMRYVPFSVKKSLKELIKRLYAKN